MEPQPDKSKRSPALRIIAGFAIASLFLLIAGLLSQSNVFSSFDLAIRDRVAISQTPFLTECFLAITKFGSTVYLFVLGSIVALVLIWLRQWYVLGIFLLAMLGEVILSNGFKFAFAMPRPEPLLSYVIEDSKSLPSGHAAASTTFYGFLSLVAAQRIAAKPLRILIMSLAAALIFLICFSRVYIGVHRPSDVIAGFVATAIWIGTLTPLMHRPVTNRN